MPDLIIPSSGEEKEKVTQGGSLLMIYETGVKLLYNTVETPEEMHKNYNAAVKKDMKDIIPYVGNGEFIITALDEELQEPTKVVIRVIPEPIVRVFGKPFIIKPPQPMRQGVPISPEFMERLKRGPKS